MDFDTMAERLDDCTYRTTKSFLAEIQKIRSECKEYCKTQDVETKPSLRRTVHRANELVDHADWLIEENVDLHLKARAEEFAQAKGDADVPDKTQNVFSGGRTSGRLRGISVPDEVFFGNPDQMARKQKELDDSLDAAMCSPALPVQDAMDMDGDQAAERSVEPEEEPEEIVECPQQLQKELVRILVTKTKASTLEQLLQMHHLLKAQLDTDFVNEVNRETVGLALKKYLLSSH
eukprot:TRINITY_DN24331_c0_g1_i1.p1 TRINITY_DN24331_c0_g1~~TRINITY_DN24331_c0_g1_i1.p1  ORF type:complete len:234 (+),score=49.97 TRINITY_DN24331_c0_g1_i1:86-787(+)